VQECEVNKEWMKVKCAPACQACDILDIRQRCPQLGDDAMPALMPGEMNHMFERIVRTSPGNRSESFSIEDGMVNYTVRVLSRPEPHDEGEEESTNFWSDVASPPWIIALDDFLSVEERDHLIRLGDIIGYNPTRTQQRASGV
jgi:prolyl 4-hydroxylase